MKLPIKIMYHELMYRIKSFLFGMHSIKAHKHLGRLIALGLEAGMSKEVYRRWRH